MFQSLTERLSTIFTNLRKSGVLSETDIDSTLREIRIALLEADVALPIAKQFIESLKKRAIGQEVVQSVTPGQMVVKIVHDHLIELLGPSEKNFNIAGTPPIVMLMVGLQGSGKTTATAKIAKYLQERSNKKVLVVSVDIYRPAAREQLEIMAQKARVKSVKIVAIENPIDTVRRAHQQAKLEGFDVLIIDTAGRLQIDEVLMSEIKAIHTFIKPKEVLLCADAMTGQDAVKIAQGFHDALGLTGIVLTRVDSDARGGTALSMRAMTGCPIRFFSTGEHIDEIELFHADRIASRILNMGDIVSLVEKASTTFNQAEIEASMKKMQVGGFDLDDMSTQISQISKIGGLGSIMSMLPGIGKIKDKIAQAGIDDSIFKKQQAIISSMTRHERKNYKILNGSRKRRIADGSGTTVPEVNRLIKQYQEMLGMMKQFKKGGQGGLVRQGIKALMSSKFKC